MYGNEEHTNSALTSNGEKLKQNNFEQRRGNNAHTEMKNIHFFHISTLHLGHIGTTIHASKNAHIFSHSNILKTLQLFFTIFPL